MTMRAHRGLPRDGVTAAAAYDAAQPHPMTARRKRTRPTTSSLVPLVKGYSTEASLEVTNLGVQVHGGMGFIEGDRRGAVLPRREDPDHLRGHERSRPTTSSAARRSATAAWRGHGARDRAADRRRRGRARRPRQRRRVPMARACAGARGIRAGGRIVVEQSAHEPERGLRRLGAPPDARRQPGRRLADGARADGRPGPVAAGDDAEFMASKIATARFYAEHILACVPGLRDCIVEGGESVVALAPKPSDLSILSPPAARPPPDRRVLCPCLPVSCHPAAADHRRAAVHHQPPQARDRAVQVRASSARCPALNARPASQLDEWLAEITETLAAHDRAHPEAKAAPFAINQIVHKSNDRLEHDMGSARSTRCRSSSRRWARAPTSTTRCTAGKRHRAARRHQRPVRAQGDRQGRRRSDCRRRGRGRPRRREEPIRAGAGDPRVVRRAAGAVGRDRQRRRGARRAGDGADFAYIGSAFIATDEARASDAYKQAIVEGTSDDIVYSSLFTGVHGNYLKPRSRAAGWTRTTRPRATRAR